MMRKGSGSSKGAAFERDICKMLSKWWTYGTRDDVFWRTAGSGGRATNRTKQGKQTAGNYGDISCTDAVGWPLLQLCCFELKRGYGSWCLLDVIDGQTKRRSCKAIQFWQQTKKNAEDSGALYPVLIFKRDQRKVCIMFPKMLAQALVTFAGSYPNKTLFIGIQRDKLLVADMQEFLDFYDPAHFIAVLQETKCTR